MRISDLSRHSDVPISTIKFYIREGLLPTGEHTHRNQARYGEEHLERLELISALRDVAGLSLPVVREVLDQLAKPWGEGDPIAEAMHTIHAVPDRDRNAAEQAEYDALCDEVRESMLGLAWTRDSHPRHLWVEQLADSLQQLRRYVDPDFDIALLERFAAVAWAFSEVAFTRNEDVVPQPGDDLVEPTRRAILGTLLLEPLIGALNRSALAHRSMILSLGETPPPVRIGDD